MHAPPKIKVDCLTGKRHDPNSHRKWVSGQETKSYVCCPCTYRFERRLCRDDGPDRNINSAVAMVAVLTGAVLLLPLEVACKPDSGRFLRHRPPAFCCRALRPHQSCAALCGAVHTDFWELWIARTPGQVAALLKGGDPQVT